MTSHHHSRLAPLLPHSISRNASGFMFRASSPIFICVMDAWTIAMDAQKAGLRMMAGLLEFAFIPTCICFCAVTGSGK